MLLAAAGYQALFDTLYKHYGPQDWWPADSITELCVGAILTQNVSWSNVEMALERMQGRGLLAFDAIEEVPAEMLADAIRPSGYHNVKARRLKSFAHHVNTLYGGDVEELLRSDRERLGLRDELLGIHGVGPETADCLLVYGAGHPAFIADTYGRRILARVGLVTEPLGYESARAQVESWNPKPPPHMKEPRPANVTAHLWGEFHGLLVRHGKEHCHKTEPLCTTCPCANICRFAVAD